MRPLAVAPFDIDLFETIDDTDSHLIGNQVPVADDQANGAAIPPRDPLLRRVGEEFLVILPVTTDNQAVLIAEQPRVAHATARPRGQLVPRPGGVGRSGRARRRLKRGSFPDVAERQPPCRDRWHAG